MRILSRLPPAVQIRLSRRPPIQMDGLLLDPTLHLVIAARPPDDRTPLTRGSPEEARLRHRRQMLALRGRPTRVGEVRDLEVEGGAGPLRARHYTPPEGREDDAKLPLLVYYHGGGFMLGDLDTHDEVCRILCRFGRQHVLSIDYRLAPEHPFPAAVEDAEAAFRWAQAHAEELAADGRHIAVGGDSAGGNLAAVVAQLTARDRPPLAQLLIYPPTGWTAENSSARLFADGFFLNADDRKTFTRNYVGDAGGDGDPRVSPLAAPDLGGLAPALVITAGFDVLRDEGEAYASALLAAGSSCELDRKVSMGHGFVQLTGVCPGAHQVTVDVAHRWNALLADLVDR